MSFTIDGAEHPTGEDCRQCWDDSWPRPCTNEGCDGLIHAVFGDESWDDYWLYYKCTKCGDTGAPE